MDCKIPLSVIFGCIGSQLTEKEQDFFQTTNPFGLILFQRNCVEPDQVRALTGHFRELVGRPKAPVFIDQEGGKVVRLKPPNWRAVPPAKSFVDLATVKSDEVARQAIKLNFCLIAEELRAIGVNVNCAPVLDIFTDDADPIIGDRALGNRVELIEKLGSALCDGLLSRGVFPVIKHIPGHGRAPIDSHKGLPIVDTKIAELMAEDFEAFRRFKKMPFAMTAHVIFSEIDEINPATVSHKVIQDVIRNHIGFEGLLISDDLSMKALSGGVRERTKLALDAGCDVVLHCNGRLEEMVLVAEGAIRMTEQAWERWLSAQELIPNPPVLDTRNALSHFDKLMTS